MSSKGDPAIVGGINQRTNHTAAMIIDLAVILRPEVGIRSGTHVAPSPYPFPIIFRTLATARRRRVDDVAPACKTR
jgi:hypothetical protein